MGRLKEWFNDPRVVITMIVMVIVLLLGMTFSAIWARGQTERYCAVQLEKAVMLATEEAAKAATGRPAELGEVYQMGEIIHCLAAVDTIDRTMGLCYRVIDDPMTARYVVSINDTGDDMSFSFEDDKMYIIRNDGDGVYPEMWTPPTTN